MVDEFEFRKFLTTYGISFEEYENMTTLKKQELLMKYESHQKAIKSQNKAAAMTNIGEGLSSCGCILMLIPVVVICLFIIFAII